MESHIARHGPVTPSESKSSYKVQVLDRAFAILDLLSRDGRGQGLVELCRELGLHKSTIHRLLMVLEHHRYVERDLATGKYRLGAKLLELASKAVARVDWVERSRPYLEQLVRETGETAHLGILRQGAVLSLANAESPRTLRTPATVGRHTPAHCTSLGKAILAYCSEARIDDFISTYGLRRYTRNTITRPAEFRAELKKIRGRGCAIDDEEFEDGLKCIGAPVRDYTGEVIAALSATGPAFRLTAKRMPALIASVAGAARQLSKALGYHERGRMTET